MREQRGSPLDGPGGHPERAATHKDKRYGRIMLTGGRFTTKNLAGVMLERTTTHRSHMARQQHRAHKNLRHGQRPRIREDGVHVSCDQSPDAANANRAKQTASVEKQRGDAVHDGSGRIVVQNLSKRFGAIPAVQNLSFTVEPGSVTGFLGPNGSGKTTTLRMLLGLVSPSSGSATVNGSR